MIEEQIKLESVIAYTTLDILPPHHVRASNVLFTPPTESRLLVVVTKILHFGLLFELKFSPACG